MGFSATHLGMPKEPFGIFEYRGRRGQSVATTESVFDIMRTCRAMRRFRPEDVSDEVVLDLLDAAIRAPSGGNAQSWRFIVVRDTAVKRALGAEIGKSTRWKATVDELRLEAAMRAGDLSPEEAERTRRSLAAFNDLGEHIAQVPALICVCAELDLSTRRAAAARPAIRCAIDEYGVVGALRFAMAARRLVEQGMWASVFPAVQNMLLAARALGLGAVLTTPQLLGPPGRLERILELPKGVNLAAVIPVGYPRGNFGPVRRRPVEEFVFRDRYGNR